MPDVPPPIPADIKALHANLHAWWRRLSDVKLPADLAAFHRWERDAGASLRGLGIDPQGEPSERITHYREAIRRHLGTLEAEHPALRARPKARKPAKRPAAKPRR